MDMREMVDKVKRSEPLYGQSTLTPYMQGVASRNSRYTAIWIHVMPWFNFVNHEQVGDCPLPCSPPRVLTRSGCLRSTASTPPNTTSKLSENWKPNAQVQGREIQRLDGRADWGRRHSVCHIYNALLCPAPCSPRNDY